MRSALKAQVQFEQHKKPEYKRYPQDTKKSETRAVLRLSRVLNTDTASTRSICTPKVLLPVLYIYTAPPPKVTCSNSHSCDHPRMCTWWDMYDCLVIYTNEQMTRLSRWRNKIIINFIISNVVQGIAVAVLLIMHIYDDMYSWLDGPLWHPMWFRGKTSISIFSISNARLYFYHRVGLFFVHFFKACVQ